MPSYVYIVANHKSGTLYVGVTTDLVKRISQHKEEITKGFTARYNVKRLVYYEVFEDVLTAIEREKEIKKWYVREVVPIAPQVTLKNLIRAHAIRHKRNTVTQDDFNFIPRFPLYVIPSSIVPLKNLPILTTEREEEHNSTQQQHQPV